MEPSPDAQAVQPENFGDAGGVAVRVKAIQTRLKLTTRQFAERLAVAYLRLVKMLGGHNPITADVLCALLAVDGVTADWLLTGRDSGAPGPLPGGPPLTAGIASGVLDGQVLQLAKNRRQLTEDAQQLNDMEARLRSAGAKLATARTELQSLEDQRVKLLVAQHRATKEVCIKAMRSDQRLFREVLIGLGLTAAGINPDTLDTQDEDLTGLLVKELGAPMVEEFRAVLAHPSAHKDGYRAYLANDQAAVERYLENLRSQGVGFDAQTGLLRAWAVFKDNGLPWYLVDVRFRWDLVRQATPRGGA